MCEADGHAEMFESKTVKLRKKAHCCECGKILEPGTECTVYSGLFEGSWFYERECQSCTWTRAAWGESEPIGGLLECIRESAAGSGISQIRPLEKQWLELKAEMDPEQWQRLVDIDEDYIEHDITGEQGNSG